MYHESLEKWGAKVISNNPMTWSRLSVWILNASTDENRWSGFPCCHPSYQRVSIQFVHNCKCCFLICMNKKVWHINVYQNQHAHRSHRANHNTKMSSHINLFEMRCNAIWAQNTCTTTVNNMVTKHLHNKLIYCSTTWNSKHKNPKWGNYIALKTKSLMYKISGIYKGSLFLLLILLYIYKYISLKRWLRWYVC